jgi:hypothetical protein
VPEAVVREGVEEAVDAPTWSPVVARCFTVAAVLLLGVIVVAGIRASLSGWTATADDAFLTLRSRDVFSTQLPLLSTASSGSQLGGETFNHPGPLALYLTAPFVAIGGSGAMPLACALINAAAVGAVALLARRNARPTLAAAVLAVTALLVWSMGSGLLADPWNPHLAMLSFLAAVVATWATLRGDPIAFPVALVFASLAGQTHLSVTPMAAVLVAVAAGAVLTRIVRSRRRDDPSELRRWVRWGAIGLGLGILSALPPIIEQVAHGTDGNLARLARSTGLGTETVGVERAVATITQKLVVPPFFGRGSWEVPVYGPTFVRGGALALGIVAVVALFVATIVTAVRRRDRELLPLALLVGGLLVTGTLLAARLPTFLLGLRLSNVRWIWPLAALTWATWVTGPAEWLKRTVTTRRAPHRAEHASPDGTGSDGTSSEPTGRAGTRPPTPIGAALTFLAVTAVAALATVPSHHDDLSGSLPADRALLEQLWSAAGPQLTGLDAIELAGGTTGRELFVSPGIINALDEAGVRVGITDAGQLQQTGEGRRSTGTEPWILTMQPADAPPPSAGARLLATTSVASPEEAASIEQRVADLAGTIRPSDLRPAGGLSDAERTQRFDAIVEEFRTDPTAALSSNGVAGLLDAGVFTVDGQDTAQLAETVRRASELRGNRISLWLAPR